jgi:hypothetical protein
LRSYGYIWIYTIGLLMSFVLPFDEAEIGVFSK